MQEKKIINQIVEKIAKTVRPQKIILFGSYAGKTPHSDSDCDLLIIKDSKLRRDERPQEIRKFLKNIIFPLDIFVYSPKEVEKLQNNPASFITKVLKTGKVVYEQH